MRQTPMKKLFGTLTLGALLLTSAVAQHTKVEDILVRGFACDGTIYQYSEFGFGYCWFKAYENTSMLGKPEVVAQAEMYTEYTDNATGTSYYSIGYGTPTVTVAPSNAQLTDPAKVEIVVPAWVSWFSWYLWDWGYFEVDVHLEAEVTPTADAVVSRVRDTLTSVKPDGSLTKTASRYNALVAEAFPSANVWIVAKDDGSRIDFVRRDLEILPWPSAATMTNIRGQGTLQVTRIAK